MNSLRRFWDWLLCREPIEVLRVKARLRGITLYRRPTGEWVYEVPHEIAKRIRVVEWVYSNERRALEDALSMNP